MHPSISFFASEEFYDNELLAVDVEQSCDSRAGTEFASGGGLSISPEQSGADKTRLLPVKTWPLSLAISTKARQRFRNWPRWLHLALIIRLEACGRGCDRPVSFAVWI